MIKECIYITGILLMIMSIPTLVYSIKNNKKNICKQIMIMSIVSVLFLFIEFEFLFTTLDIEVGLEIIFFSLIIALVSILYIVSVIISFIKSKKLEQNSDSKKFKRVCIYTYLGIILLLSISILRDKYFIVKSSVIVVCYDNSGGGVANSFGYAISDDFCKSIQMGVDYTGDGIKEFLPKGYVEIDKLEDIDAYDIKVTDSWITVYDDGKCIHKKKHKREMNEAEVIGCFYRK